MNSLFRINILNDIESLYSKDFKLIFIVNSKVACSSIKKSLLGRLSMDLDTVHALVKPLNTCMFPSKTPIFALTRNPYSRALSAYRHVVQNKTSTWNDFADRYGFDIDATPSFLEVLVALSNDQQPKNIDQHFIPQFYSLGKNDLDFDFLGRLENMQAVADFLSGYNVQLETFAPHATKSNATYKEIITKEEELLINKIYKDDFITYGYEMDLQSDFVPDAIVKKKRLSLKLQIRFYLRYLDKLYLRPLYKFDKN